MQTIEMIQATESSDAFFDFLDRPAWFKANLQGPFDKNRKDTGGIIFLMKEEKSTVGCIYCEITSKSISYGKFVPIFGWIQAKSFEIFQNLMLCVEKYAKDHNCAVLRGPINPPKTFGGYGAQTQVFEASPLVGLAQNTPELANWLSRLGYAVDAEFVTLHITKPIHIEPVPHIKLESPKLTEIFQNPNLLKEVTEFIQQSFSGYLPDTSTAERMADLLQRMAIMPKHDHYYVLARDLNNQKIAGLLLEVPNWFEEWQGKPITMSNFDTAIVGKAYRGLGLYHIMYEYLYARVEELGIHWHEGGMVWTKNTAGLKTFGLITEPYRYYQVFQKYF